MSKEQLQLMAGILGITHKHRGLIEHVAWSPEGQQIASAGLFDGIHVWDATTGKTQAVYEAHTDLVRHVAFAPDGQLIASCSEDGKVHLWEAETGVQHAVYTKHTLPVQCVAWSPCGQFLASVDATTVHVWTADSNLTSSQPRQLLVLGKQEEFIFTTGLWTRDGKRLVTCSEGSLQRWDTASGKLLDIWDYREIIYADLIALAESPDGLQLALADDDAVVHVVCAQTGNIQLSHPVRLDASWGLAWSPDGRSIASCGYAAVYVWDARSGQTVCAYHEHDGSVSAVAWSPDTRQIASAGVDGSVQVWRVPG